MKNWKCKKCGYEMQADTAPEKCPHCGAEHSFEEQE